VFQFYSGTKKSIPPPEIFFPHAYKISPVTTEILNQTLLETAGGAAHIKTYIVPYTKNFVA
jgi:hypothetical protein